MAQQYNYHNKVVTIVGLGKTGLSCVDFFQAQGAIIQVMDTRAKPSGLEQLSSEIKVHTGGLHLEWLLHSDLIVISPGLSLKTPEIQRAINAGVEVVGDIELFCRAVNKPIVAITGSNGKSTVTTLVYEMAKATGIKVGIGGNIGVPALSLLPQNNDLYVLELSSFQLETTKSLCAAAATVLNVTEDHMNRYVDLEDYRQAKLKIYQNAKVAIINADDKLTDDVSLSANHQLIKRSFAVCNADYHLLDKNNRTFLAYQGEEIIACDELRLTGRHNYLNALAALALADAVAIPREGALQALRQFAGLEHRFQTVHEENGVRWVNDSKATNVGSTQAALNGLTVTGKLHLLLGGDGKGADFSELAPLLAQDFIYCYCFGQDKQQLAKLSSQSQCFDTMAQAVEVIRSRLQNGDMVLLSPACASLDQFTSFEARGEEFVRLAKGIELK